MEPRVKRRDRPLEAMISVTRTFGKAFRPLGLNGLSLVILCHCRERGNDMQPLTASLFRSMADSARRKKERSALHVLLL
jgi:hypothetical protein